MELTVKSDTPFAKRRAQRAAFACSSSPALGANNHGMNADEARELLAQHDDEEAVQLPASVRADLNVNDLPDSAAIQVDVQGQSFPH